MFKYTFTVKIKKKIVKCGMYLICINCHLLNFPCANPKINKN